MIEFIFLKIHHIISDGWSQMLVCNRIAETYLKLLAGERPELKIVCECRKPKPGLLLQAASDLNIDLASSWMIGDSESDLLAGRAAGCKVALLTREPQNMKADVACQA